MQIDFHHGATYACCRIAGLSHDDAAVVAHASQYVDDATNDGPLEFETGERYVRVTSAHPHQGFVGMVHDFNKVDGIEAIAQPAYAGSAVFRELQGGATAAKAFVANHLPVGHAGVLTLPDLPFPRWRFTFGPNFIDSNWKKFHDAVQYHRLFVLHELLPRHGLVAS